VKVILLAPANNAHTIKWLDYYDKQGIETVNVSLESHRDHDERNHWTNIKRYYLRLPFKGKISYPLTANQLKRIIKQEKPDILHAHYASSYGLIGSLANFHPFIVSVWGSDVYVFPNQNLLMKKLLQYTLNKADRICATSINLMEETKRYHLGKDILLTPFGVDTEVFKPDYKRQKSSGKITIGLVKGMDWKYGVDYLIKAFKLLEHKLPKEDFDNIDLVIAGDGPFLHKYKKLANKLMIQEKVIFKGRIKHEEVPLLLNDMDIFVVPSLIESFGVSALEAQACGLPVIASDVGGLPEVVVHEKTGFIVPEKDEEAIAGKLVVLINNSQLREEYGNNAIQFIKSRYDWEDNALIMLNLYNELNDKQKSKLTLN
jgi:glycosyltransferase involved in cell wall biosynthesis